MEREYDREYGCTYDELIVQLRRMGSVGRTDYTMLAEMYGCRKDDIAHAIKFLIQNKILSYKDGRYSVDMSICSIKGRWILALGEVSMTFVPLQLIELEDNDRKYEKYGQYTNERRKKSREARIQGICQTT